ncbi:MAG TPA: M56 family metallopeptidase [Bacillota bacterium]|nr:M56 family metallopeptidase [Bacillota bacterium]
MWTYTLLPEILNMSLTASIVIVLVLVVRLLLQKSPKAFSYALWAVVLFRLLCPVSFSSEYSLLSLFNTSVSDSGAYSSMTYIPSDIVHAEYPRVDLPLPDVSEAINETLPQGQEQLAADPLEFPMSAATILWLLGTVVMLIYSAVSLYLLQIKLIGAVRLRDNIFLADHIATPFVIGIFRPKIYLPSTILEQEQDYIILHEQTHIKRLDHIAKMIAFLALAMHWFNPLVWVAFICAVKDMEMSCDERVLKQMGGEIKTAYSTSLLSLATGHRLINGSPLAFGEGNIKGRIKNVINFRKPAAWVIIVAAVAVIIVTACLLTNPANSSSDISTPNAAQNLSDKRPMLMVDGQIYLDTGKEITVQLKPGTVMGEIKSSVDASEVPTQDSQSNFGSEGAPYFHMNDGLAVMLNDKWYLFEKDKVTSMPENEPAGNSNYYGFNVGRLSALRTPYVGNNSAVSAVVNLFPRADASLNQRFISIGDDYGSGLAPNTLTLYYEPADGYNVEDMISVPNGGFAQNALLLFALIDNLEEVSFAARDSVAADDQLHKDEYFYRWTVTREDMGVYVDNDWANAWENGKLSVASALGRIANTLPPIAPSQIPKGDYVTRYDKVEIAILLKEREQPIYEFESTDYQIVAYIDTKIRQSSPYDKSPPQNSQTKLYNIKLSNEISSYACGLYYDTLNNEAYIVRDGGPSVTDVEFAQYIESIYESSRKE